MDLAMDVLPTPSPVRPGQVGTAADFALTGPLNHLTDAYELPEKIECGYVGGVLAKYEKAVARAASAGSGAVDAPRRERAQLADAGELAVHL